MTQPPKPPSKTALTNFTQFLQSMPTRVRFSRVKLKPNAKVPELWVQTADSNQAEVFPLLGEQYRLGRSSQSCDIVVRNPLVSSLHLSVSRDRSHRWFLGAFPRTRFEVRDENSTNGLYRGKTRLNSKILYHNDLLTLGPPELADAVRIQFKEEPAWWVKGIRYSLWGLAGITVLGLGAILVEWQKFKVFPLPNSVQGPVVVIARDETTISPLPPTQTHQEVKSLGDVSQYLPKAIMASEDARFNWHFGVDPIGTFRAIIANLQGGGIKEGGSTLTQQLARNLLRSYVGTEDSAGRKLKEAAVALKLEMRYSKDDLMRIYLNRVYLGYGTYGFSDAARFYFDKTPKDLNLSEAATLAGILPAPNAFNPVRDYQSAIEYRNRVLKRMAEQGMVSVEEANRARRSPLQLSPKAQETLSSGLAPYYYSQVLNELDELLGQSVATEGNYIVETGLDLKLQAQAESSLRDTVAAEGGAGGFSQGAIATMNFRTGEILASVGGVDFRESQFNRVNQARRQPGSTFKIFTYTAALESGKSPGDTISCAPLNWEGQDFAGCGGGDVTLATGLAQSYNPVALRLAREVGLGKVAQMARRMGVTSRDLKEVPGLVLGQSEVSLIEMVGAFGVLGNGGIKAKPRTIKRILDSSDCTNPRDYKTCRVLYPLYNQGKNDDRPVIAPEIAQTMTTMLQSAVAGGTGRAAAIGLGEAGKTGTTNEGVDLWFVGYVPSREVVTGVWLGNDDNTPTGNSSAQAAKLWAKYMGTALR
jgi:membrane peptidoglycan carboxypeptidase